MVDQAQLRTLFPQSAGSKNTALDTYYADQVPHAFACAYSENGRSYVNAYGALILDILVGLCSIVRINEGNLVLSLFETSSYNVLLDFDGVTW